MDVVVIMFSATLIMSPIAAAQTPPATEGRGNQPPPPPMTNLQIFPKDTPRPQVVTAMQGFALALGVRCEHCHVVDEGPGKQDFASDDKKTKTTARQMMVMTREINEKVPAAVGKSASEATRVQCVTCHRGVTIPKQLGDILIEAVQTSGSEGAIAKYRELRKQYYGGMAYDFSENGLVIIAQRLIQANKPDDALALLQLNTEFYPQSARTYISMFQAYQRKSDTASAIKSLEKAVELDPQNAQAKRMLEQLKK
jgi:hypothetical protein